MAAVRSCEKSYYYWFIMRMLFSLSLSSAIVALDKTASSPPLGVPELRDYTPVLHDCAHCWRMSKISKFSSSRNILRFLRLSLTPLSCFRMGLDLRSMLVSTIFMNRSWQSANPLIFSRFFLDLALSLAIASTEGSGTLNWGNLSPWTNRSERVSDWFVAWFNKLFVLADRLRFEDSRRVEVPDYPNTFFF